jgi:5-formyltetrahydrofolate cyclo-ligase
VSLAEQKREARRRATAAVMAMPTDVRRASDAAIVRTLCERNEYTSSQQLLAYWPLEDEVSLTELLLLAVEAGKVVLLPRVADGTIGFHTWSPEAGLEPGALGVSEPFADGERPDPGVPSFVLVPGRAFDVAGNRLGRGGGYYDKVWKELASFGPRCGVSYACQIGATVPHDERDSIVDLLVCERGMVIDRGS